MKADGVFIPIYGRLMNSSMFYNELISNIIEKYMVSKEDISKDLGLLYVVSALDSYISK